jgi:hypothetical protein
MSATWCMECGLKGEPTPAAVILGCEEMCIAHARSAGYSEEEIELHRLATQPPAPPAPPGTRVTTQKKATTATPSLEERLTEYNKAPLAEPVPQEIRVIAAGLDVSPETLNKQLGKITYKEPLTTAIPGEIKTVSKASHWCSTCRKVIRSDSPDGLCKQCRGGPSPKSHRGNVARPKKPPKAAPAARPAETNPERPTLTTLLVSEAQLVRMFAALPIEDKALVLQIYLREAEP